VGRPAMSLAVRPPRGSPQGPLCHTWSSIDYVLNCIIFAINFDFVVVVCHPHTCCPVYLFCTTCGDKHIPKIERIGYHNKIIIIIRHFIHSELIQ
jgi:hypothetical protein